ncbi:hypothetical protein [Pseudoclavibacter sp. 8L]|uniref:hypothetical protein n=1 Tax=Pseudoclavibacter sp. 8L TaxID=2653162 RepID=UPI0012F1D39D|nr:hypothetical protein [Pseudoclavibacter sp. 8L]VXB75320.1 conserved hypothetical protein [Pseudoclavibacter sp. 8L]
MITHEALTGVETKLARRVLTVAHSIAPTLDDLEGEPRQNAIAILQGVAEEAAAFHRRLRSQSTTGARVDYTSIESWFSADDRAGLRSLCKQHSASGPHPIGQFPKPGLLTSIWPEDGSPR